VRQRRLRGTMAARSRTAVAKIRVDRFVDTQRDPPDAVASGRAIRELARSIDLRREDDVGECAMATAAVELSSRR